MTPKNTNFLTLNEVTDLLGMNAADVQDLPIPRYQLSKKRAIYNRADVEAFQNNKPPPKPKQTNSKKALLREELAEWIRYNTGSVKRWGWSGCGPVYQRGTNATPPQYPLKTVQAWLLSCRVDPATAEAA